ncbi:FUN14 domain-containing protein [uncultured Thiodictyon sp.]|uniref:FUN14 domain-containing protein n=1 Tax=uncultured Thiodictyon sp. TaxID=1846217 RepID=UPI0025D8A492|nr:FUN14 domain-containing protein [uncultured Thiodictyon sp.]
MYPLNCWIPALALAPAALFGTAAAAQPVAGTPAAPAATDLGTLFNEAFFLKLGFSFMVGLAVGKALKVAFKLALIVIGVVLLGIFGLQYAGLAKVDWSGVEGHYDTWATWLSGNGGAFLDFIGKNLRETAAFVAGLAVGFKI